MPSDSSHAAQIAATIGGYQQQQAAQMSAHITAQQQQAQVAHQIAAQTAARTMIAPFLSEVRRDIAVPMLEEVGRQLELAKQPQQDGPDLIAYELAQVRALLTALICAHRDRGVAQPDAGGRTPSGVARGRAHGLHGKDHTVDQAHEGGVCVGAAYPVRWDARP